MKSKVHELLSVKFGVIPITVYRGCLVTKLIGGWEVWGKRVSTPDEIDQLIDEAGTILNESIDRGGVSVKDGFSCTNDSLLPNPLPKTESGIISSPDDFQG